MRNVASMLLLLMVLFAAANVGAADRVEMRNGSLRIAQSAEPWQQTDVVVTPEAQKYPTQWQEAFKNPGTIVPVKTSIRFGAMSDLVHQQKETVLELGVVRTGTVIDVVPEEGRVIKSETFYNSYIFFWAAAMLVMATSHWLRWRGRDTAASISAFSALLVAFTSLFTNYTVATFLSFFAAIMAALVVVIVSDKEDSSGKHKAAAEIFYVAMIISIIAFYA